MKIKYRKLFCNKWNYVVWLLYLLTISFFLLPILYVVSMSLKTPAEIFGNPSLMPNKPTLENYIFVLNNTKIPIYILNSFKLVFMTVTGTLVVASLSAYALSRFQFKNKNIIILIILMFQMVSAVVLCIPIFRFFGQMKLLNNYWALGFIHVATQLPFGTYLLKGVFDGVPKEIDESAKIDGASRFTTLLRIILPCSKSGISSSIIFLSINAWSSFLLPFVLINKDKLNPVSVGILSIQTGYHEITIQYLAAASVLGLLPAVLLVVILQKFIISAMLSGAIKG